MISANSNETPLEPIHILAVEDEPVVGEAIRTTLELEFGVPVDLAPDGATAVQLTSSKNYDLVVLDWSVPHPSGLDLLKHWRKTSMVNRVIVLTAWSDQEIRAAALTHGANDFLTKPFCLDELRSRARKQMLQLGCG